MRRLVLIVDDSPQVASNLEIALLGMPGVEVAVADSGLEALRVLEGRAPAVAAVITDLEMPRMDGFELIRRMRSDPRYARVPIIVSSGNCDPEAPSRARAVGADAYFAKPYSPAEMRSHIERLLLEK